MHVFIINFIEKEHIYQMAIKDFIVQNNMTTTEFSVYRLLAKNNIEDNQKLCQNLQQIENRIVPNMETGLIKKNLQFVIHILIIRARIYYIILNLNK